MDATYIKILIRRALIKDPAIGVEELGKLLDIDKNTAWKYRTEVIQGSKERMEVEIEKLKKRSLEEELIDMEEEIKELVRELWSVVGTTVNNRNKINALRTIILAKKNLFDLKFDAGLFIRKIGDLGVTMGDLTKLVKGEIKENVESNTGADKDNPEGNTQP